MAGRETELSSPPNSKLKGIFSIFKAKHATQQDQQVTSGGTFSSQFGHEHVLPEGSGAECREGQPAGFQVSAACVVPASQHPASSAQWQDGSSCRKQAVAGVPINASAAVETSITKSTSDVAAHTAATCNRAAFDSARDNAISDPGLTDVPSAAPAAPAVPAQPLPISQRVNRSSSGSTRDPSVSSSSGWLHESAGHCHSAASSPAPIMRSSTGLAGSSSMRGSSKLCASVDDLYNVIFGDAPAPSGSAAGSPCPPGQGPTRQGSVASMGSFSNLQYCSRSINMSVECSSERQGGFFGCGGNSMAVSTAANSNTTTFSQLDELIMPAGLSKLKVSSRRSGSDGSDSGFFLEDSPTCSSSGGVGGPTWPQLQPVAAVAAAIGAAGANRGSPRYGLPVNSTSSAAQAGAEAGASQPQHQHLIAGGIPRSKRRWDRRQQAALFDANSSGSRSAAGSPCMGAAADSDTGAGGGVWRTHSSPAGPGSLAELAARLGASAGGDGTRAQGSSAHSNSSCSATPLSHSYSNSDIPAGAPPACARALFGSVPQMDRPLGSSCWLARADSGLIDDHLSVASDDEFIREINSENVLSSAWGPANAKLLSFKYCVATSPLNHPGRSSPFKGSPYSSPRGSNRDSGMSDLLPLRSATAAVSCPGSPLGHTHLGNSSDDSSAAALAAAQQQRHRHPFGRCSHEQSGVYKPSPLQHKQQRGYHHEVNYGHQQQAMQHQEQEQRQGLQQQRQLRQQSSSSGELPSQGLGPEFEQAEEAGEEAGTGCTPSDLPSTPPHSEALPGSEESEGLLTVASSSGSSVIRILPQAEQAAQAAAATAASSTVGGQQVAGQQVVEEAGSAAGWQHVHNPDCAAAASAAAVGALMAGWGKAARAVLAAEGQPGTASAATGTAGTDRNSSSSSSRQPRYGIKHRTSGTMGRTAAAAGVPPLMLRVSGNSSPAAPPPAAAADAAAAVAPAQAAIAAMPSSGGGSSSAIIRSRSMPAANITTSSVSGALPGSMSLPGGIMGQLSTAAAAAVAASDKSFSGGPPLLLASSSDLPPKLLVSDSPGRRDKPRRHSSRVSSSRVSSSSVSNPSRLSQSSAAGEEATEPLTASASGQLVVRGSRHSSSSSSMCSAGPAAAEALSSSCSPAAVSGSGKARRATVDTEYGRATADSSCIVTAAAYGGTASISKAGSAADAVCAVEGTLEDEAGSYCSCDSDADAAGVLDASDLALSWASTCSPSNRLAQRNSLADSQAGAGGASAATMPSLPEVDFIERIGRGSFGEVYRGVWCGSVVAVKVIRVRQQAPPGSRLRSAAAGTARPAALAASVAGSSWGGGDISSYLPEGVSGADSGSSIMIMQLEEQQGEEEEPDEHEQQVAVELAQHEYESWLNANLRHPNIVQLFTSFTVVMEDRPAAAASPAAAALVREGGYAAGVWGSGLSWKTHLVMEFCELGTMQAVLQRGLFVDPHAPNHCNPLWVLATAKEFCVAIAYLHSMDVVHGDLKSSNVLLKAAATTAWDSRGFVAKVSDFGLSRVMDAISAANGTTSSSTTASTCGDSAAAAAAAAINTSGAPIGQWPAQPHFGALSHAAPELIRGEELSQASDVYSVGVLLWEMVTGQAPFYGMHPGQLLNAKLTHPTSQLLPFPDTAPPGLVALCMDCWAEGPAQRPSMHSIVDRLNGMAVELLGEEQAVLVFPDIARALSAQRRSAAAAAGVPFAG